jgi:glycosyltransferase involved in cell wall biosynthesis
MKLLIITQKVDQNDDILGFFHGWIAEFAKHAEQVTVIALGVGEYHLPDNVRVFSLGKERGVSRFGYILNFYRLVFRERKNYDTVFVHMNQEYVLLGGFLWKLLRKKITMWRNHYAGSSLTHIAMALSDKLFCTSRYSFTAGTKKTILMPVGIDTELFKKDDQVIKKTNSVLFLARISPSKKPHLILEALRILQDEGVQFTANFYGNPLLQDVPYADSLKQKVKEYSLNNRVMFEKGVPNSETPHIYGAHTVFINSSPSGMYDKTIFEAMACESLILTSNLNLKGQIDDRFLFAEDDAHDLAQKLKAILSLDNEAQEKYGKMLRNYVVEKQSLSLLAQALKNNL